MKIQDDIIEESSMKKRKLEEIEVPVHFANPYDPTKMPKDSFGEPYGMKPTFSDEKYKLDFKNEDQYALFSALPLTNEQKTGLVSFLKMNKTE